MHGRYITDNEAAHKILGQRMYGMEPPVEQMPVHLKDMQMVAVDGDEGNFREVRNAENAPETKLTAYFKRDLELYGDIKYDDMPEYFTWNDKDKVWRPRRRGKVDDEGRIIQLKVARIAPVSPRNKEKYFLRQILFHKACSSYEDALTWEGHTHPTYESAAMAMGLTLSDSAAEKTMDEAVGVILGEDKVRNLFTVLLLYTNIEDPPALFEKFVEKMSRDFLRQRTAAMNPEVARNLVLSEIEAKLQSEGKSLDDFKLPQVDEELILEFRSPLLNAELNYDIPALQREVDQAERTLNVDQRAAFNAVYESIFE